MTTVGDLKKLLAPMDDSMPVVCFYDLNDWPGDAWSDVQQAAIARPIDLTGTGAAHPRAKTLSCVLNAKEG